MSKTYESALFLALAALGALTVACAGPGSSEPSDSDTPAMASTSAEVSPTDGSGMPSDDVPTAMLEQAIADAASGAGVDPSDVRVVTAEAVTWSDGSLGCPEPGMMYTQALVPGYRLIVEIEGEELHFHASESGAFALCDDPQPPADDGTVDR